MKISFIATKANDGSTVGFFLSQNGVSKRMLTRLKRQPDGITVNGVHSRTIDHVRQGDVVAITATDQKLLTPNPNLCVQTAYENNGLVVFDKPPFMPVHPSIRHQSDTLGNFFAYKYPLLGFRPINRLDRDTSGLCAVAKDSYHASVLQYSIKKTYCAVVFGNIRTSGTIDLPIARREESIIIREVSPKGRRAVTHYKPLFCANGMTLLEISLETGRTHQIRVHFSHIGHPLVGDDLYGKASPLINRHALHCSGLDITTPDGNTVAVKSPIPQDMQALLN